MCVVVLHTNTGDSLFLSFFLSFSLSYSLPFSPSSSQVPWNALRSMLKISIYGNRIDNTFDQRMLEDLIDRIFVRRRIFEIFSAVVTQNMYTEK